MLFETKKRNLFLVVQRTEVGYTLVDHYLLVNPPKNYGMLPLNIANFEVNEEVEESVEVTEMTDYTNIDLEKRRMVHAKNL